MKCFSLLFLIFSYAAFAQEIDLSKVKSKPNLFLSPATTTVYLNGDLVTINLDTNLSDSELKKYEGKRIAGKFFIVKFTSGLKKQFQAFVLNPSKQKTPRKKGEIAILSEDFKFQFDQSRIAKDFIVLHKNYEKPEEVDWTMRVIATLLFLIFSLLSFQFILKPISVSLKKKKRRKEKARFYIEKLESVNSREDFEYIYRVRNEIERFLEFDGDAFNKFYEELNKIQYKKDWSNEDQTKLEKIFKRKGEVRFKNGI